MLIGEFSKVSKVSIDTLRYYDKIGLLVPKRLDKKRFYKKEDIKKLEIINSLKDMNFSLKDIRVILELDEKIDKNLKNDSKCIDEINVLLGMVDKKYKVILKQEKSLRQTKERLNHIKEKLKNFIEEEDCNEL